jgi:hypothetical protein
MDSKAKKVVLALVALAGVVALFVVLSGGEDDSTSNSQTTAAQTQTTTAEDAVSDDEPPPDEQKPDKPDKPDKPEIPVIEIKGGQPVGGVAELEYKTGDQIQFTVESDVDENIHLHGYDIEQPVAAGGKTTFDLEASIEGVFEVELEEAVVPIAEITVNPG